MRLPHAFVFSDERCQADCFRSVECEVPPGSVAHFFPGLSLNRVAVLNEQFAGLWMVSFRQSIESIGRYFAPKIQRVRKLAVPLAAKRAALREIRIRRSRILRAVITLYFTAGEWFRDVKHRCLTQ